MLENGIQSLLRCPESHYWSSGTKKVVANKFHPPFPGGGGFGG